MNNNYQLSINPELYEKTPKAVFAGLLVSYLVNHKGLEFQEINEEILREWNLLIKNGIISEKQKSKFKNA